MLFAAYTRFAVIAAENKKTIDSRLIINKRKLSRDISVRRTSAF